MNTMTERPSQKLIGAALAAAAFAIIGTVGVLIYLGVFSNAVLKQTFAPEYRIAYLPHQGPYNEIKDTIEQVKIILEEAGIKPIAAAALFLDDPSVVPEKELRSKVGYLVEHREYLPGTVENEIIQSQEVIQASFDGSPMIGSYKSYGAMRKWSLANNYTMKLPALEIYYDDGVVEYMLPISK